MLKTKYKFKGELNKKPLRQIVPFNNNFGEINMFKGRRKTVNATLSPSSLNLGIEIGYTNH